MTDKNKRWARINDLLESALALPDNKRRAWLEFECGDDAEMLDEVLALLSFDAQRSGRKAGICGMPAASAIISLMSCAAAGAAIAISAMARNKVFIVLPLFSSLYQLAGKATQSVHGFLAILNIPSAGH